MKISAITGLVVAVSMHCAQAVTCSVSSNGLFFGNYLPTSTANLDAVRSVIVTCDGIVNASLSLSVGNGAGASYSGGRKMTQNGGTATLTYNLYADENRTQVWGDNTNGSITRQVNGLSNFSRTVFGRIPGAQRSTPPGNFSDLVIITVQY